MAQPLPLILQLTDFFTERQVALRLEDDDQQRTLGQILDQYLRRCSGGNLLATGAMDAADLRTWQALQDLVYACDDRGRLGDMFSGIAFRQQGRLADLAAAPVVMPARAGETAASVIDLTIDRASVGYQRNWVGFHRRRWNNDLDFFHSFVQSTLTDAYGAEGAAATLQLDSPERRLRFIRALARRIWESDFENYSRFIGERLMFKTGDETVRNIAEGSGGICTEKVQALKFLTDHYGLESEYLVAGDKAREPAPVDKLREMLATFDFRFAKRYMRYWQHTALLYHLEGRPVLVDATNGNIPFLCLAGAEAERMLGYTDKPALKVKMVEAEEDYFYHRVPQDIPQNLLFALEGPLLETAMVQVFENELGLYLSDEYYVTPLPYRSDREYQRLRREYLAICQRAGFAGAVSREWTLDFDLGRQFAAANPQTAAKVLDSREYLLEEYNSWYRPGHVAGLVIFHLNRGCREAADTRGKGQMG